MKKYRLADLIDVAALQRMADSLYQSTGMPTGIIDATDNSIIVGSGLMPLT
ncbi:PocR ligand-binding domain-containing protein [Desulfatibacillum aliphaticivorans]|uniref:PocR ligand-binding domain-containing protein n=1 Tax=Desulfatibacillum aliphaticivorans TaxID=218208 RepID=UPI000160192D|nr:PocR ligand-binding domain-containing protein [Desulfatibacillum aliphaticivorans]